MNTIDRRGKEEIRICPLVCYMQNNYTFERLEQNTKISFYHIHSIIQIQDEKHWYHNIVYLKYAHESIHVHQSNLH